MADEPNKEHPEDIQSILSDLDAILTDMGGDAASKPPPAKPAAAAPPPPAEVKIPPPAEPPKPAPVVPPPPPPSVVIPPPPAAAAPSKPEPIRTPPPPATPKPPSIELAPREGMIKPAEKIPEPPKPAAKLPEQHPPIELSATPAPVPAPGPIKPPEPVKPPVAAKAPEPAKPVPAPAPAAPSPAAAPAKPAAGAPQTKLEPLPADTPKEQIRRVAYVYTGACAESKDGFMAFLSQAARTISKKPLFLRDVLAHEVTASSDPNAVVEKARQAKAAAVLAVVEGWPAAKIDELSEACSRANLLFRSVAPGDTLKKSTAVDIIVDMMLLPGEN